MATKKKPRIAELQNDSAELPDLTDDGLAGFDSGEEELPLVDEDQEQRAFEAEGEGDEDLDLLDEEFEESRLTGKQKVFVFLTVTLSFWIFTAVFFPLDDAIRHQLRSYEKTVAVDFATLDLNLLGDDTMGGFSAELANVSIGFSAEQIKSELSWFDLLASAPKGLVQFENAEFHMQGFAFDAATMDLNLDIEDAERLLTTSRGRVRLLAGGVKFTQLPLDSLPIPISLDELEVRRLDLVLNFSNGGVDFEDSNLLSDLFTARLSGTGRIGQTLSSTTLQAKLCIKPGNDLENKNPELFTVYIMGGGAAGGELCVDIGGTVARPQLTVQRNDSGGFGQFSGEGVPGEGDDAGESNAVQPDAPEAEPTGEPG
ncbi:MAG: type II secretion system protein GspN [bacterium]|nr:type II secretion system protein GspN [bacterium]